MKQLRMAIRLGMLVFAAAVMSGNVGTIGGYDFKKVAPGVIGVQQPQQQSQPIMTVTTVTRTAPATGPNDITVGTPTSAAPTSGAPTR